MAFVRLNKGHVMLCYTSLVTRLVLAAYTAYTQHSCMLNF